MNPCNFSRRSSWTCLGLAALLLALAPLGACAPREEAEVEPEPWTAEAPDEPAAWDRTAGEETAESEVGDALLVLKVKTSLLSELGTEAVGIDVEADDGRVILAGEVDAQELRDRAEGAAGTVSGVVAVDNRLTVAFVEPEEPPPPGVLADLERQARDAALVVAVKTELIQELGRHGLVVNVDADGGEVTLSGRLPDEDRRQMALQTARETDGVARVIDRLEVG